MTDRQRRRTLQPPSSYVIRGERRASEIGLSRRRSVVRPEEAKEAQEAKQLKTQAPKEAAQEAKETKVNSTVERLQNVILKLQDKLLASARKVQSLSDQVNSLQEENTVLHNATEAAEESFELLTLEKEYLDEQNQQLSESLAALTEEYERLKQQQKQHRSNNTDKNSGDHADESRLREALEILQQQSEEMELELAERIEVLEVQVAENSQYKDKYIVLEEELAAAKVLVKELQTQLESLSGSSELIEALSEKNEALGEENSRLKDVVQELEDLRDLANDLEEAHLQTEQELREDAARLQRALEADKATIARLERESSYLERLLDTQRERHDAELERSRASIDDHDIDGEVIEEKLDELSIKIARLGAEKLAVEAEKGVISAELSKQTVQQNAYRDLVDVVVDDKADKLHNIVSFGALSQSIVSVLQSIYKIILEDEILDSTRLYHATNIRLVESVVAFLEARFQAQYDDSFDYHSAVSILERIDLYLKKTAEQMAQSEFRGPYSSISESVIGLIVPLGFGEQHDSISCLFSLQNTKFPGKNRHLSETQTAIYTALNRVSVKFLDLITHHVADNDDIDNAAISNLEILSKKLRTMRIYIKKRNSPRVVEWSLFEKQIRGLQEVAESLLTICQKVESVLDSEEDVFDTVDWQKMVDVGENINLYLNKEEEEEQKADEQTDIREETEAYKEYFNTIYKPQLSANVDLVEDLKVRLEEAQAAASEKEELVSQYLLRISILKEKLDTQGVKDKQISELTLQIKRQQQELSSQRELVKKLAAANDQQRAELRKRHRNKNLIGEFESVFEEKEYVAKSALLSQIQSHRDLVSYLGAQIQNGSINATQAIFGLPITSNWTVKGPSKTVQFPKLDDFRVASVPLQQAAKEAKLLKVERPENVFQWRPKEKVYAAFLNSQRANLSRRVEEFVGRE